MDYSYDRLWKLMIDKKINKTTLLREAGITSNAMAKYLLDVKFSMDVLSISNTRANGCKLSGADV